jgi:putative transposase
LESTYAIVFFDAIRVKIRNEGMVNNRAVYLAIGVRCSGHKEILGLWIEQTEGAKFWLRVMTEIRNRGTQDILIAVVDGLKGFPEAITSVFPKAVVQTCIVHLIRYSMPFRVLEGSKGRGRGAQADLPGGIGRCGTRAARGIRPRRVGPEISGDRAELEAQLRTGDPLLRVCSRGAQDPLHHQRHRESQRQRAKGGPGPWPLPE